LIDYSVSEFKRAGLKQVILHIGPWVVQFQRKCEELERELREIGCALRIECHHDFSQTLLGALQQCIGTLDGPFIYWDGDVIVPPGTLQKFINLSGTDYSASVACSDVMLAPTHLQIVVDGGKASAIEGRVVNPASRRLCGIGAYLFQPEVSARIISERHASDIDDVVRDWVNANGALGAYEIGPCWDVVHTQDDLRRARSAKWISTISTGSLD
jgi:NDP-sugar pyrophosphorylase family protein